MPPLDPSPTALADDDSGRDDYDTHDDHDVDDYDMDDHDVDGYDTEYVADDGYDDEYYDPDDDHGYDDPVVSDGDDDQPPPPDDPHDRSTSDARGALARLLIIGAIATVLSSQHLLTTAERMPFGRTRTIAVAMAGALDDAVGSFELDEPDRWIRVAIGRPLPDDASGIDGVEAAARDLLHSAAVPDPPSSANPVPTTAGPPAPGSAEATTQTTTAPTTTTAPVRTVDETNKLRVWAGGDSLGEYVGNQLLHPLSDNALSQVQLDYHISTGLTRPDFFDWPNRMLEVMAQEAPPEALVFMAGGNDDQNMSVDGAVLQVGTPEWYDEYTRRVAALMDAGRSDVGHLYWIGLPPMRDQPRHDVARAVNVILSAEAEQRPWVTFVDIEQRFTGPDGNFSTNIADPTGQQKVARAPDGIHITYTGSTWIAEDIWAAIGERWNLGAAPAPPAPVPTTAPLAEAPSPDPAAASPAPLPAAPEPLPTPQPDAVPAPVETVPPAAAPPTTTPPTTVRPPVKAPPNRYQ